MSDIKAIVAQHGGKPFLFEDGRIYSYSQLMSASEEHRKVLEKVPPNAGVYVLEATNTFSTYAKICALLSVGRVFLPVSSFQFNDIAYRALLRDELSSNLILWAQNKSPEDQHSSSGFLHAAIADSQKQKKLVFVVRTSGSSGNKPKFVLHDSNNFINKYRRIGPHFEKTMAFSPTESIAGLETFLETVVHGCFMVTAKGSFEPKTIATLLAEQSVDYFQTTPTFLNLALLSGATAILGPSLKKIAFGSEPVLKGTLTTLKSKMPWLKLSHTYGMSEIGILSTETSDDDPSVFKLNAALNPGRINNGLLEVKSSTPLLCYLNYPNSDKEWFETHDIIEKAGEFCRVLGRNGDLINIAGNKFFPSELEAKLMSCPGILDVAVCREDNPLIGSALIARVNIKPDIKEQGFRENFKRFCEAALPAYMQPHRLIVTTEVLSNSRFKKSRRL